MAHRSAVRRVVNNASAALRTRPSPVPPVYRGVPSVVFQGHDRYEGSRSIGWEEEFPYHFAKQISFPYGITGISRDSDEESRGSDAISGVSPVRKNWEPTTSSVKMTGISSVQTDVLGRFSGHRSGNIASLAGAANVFPRASNGPLRRSFSSVPVRAEGAQIAVDRELLDSPQAALSGVSEAESAVVSLPSSDSMSEVAAAVADCSYPTAFLQHVIDGIHMSTGLPWWLSIVATTVAIRVLVLPLMVHQMKSTARLTLVRPELEKLTNRIKESGYDSKVVDENQIRMKALFIKHKTSPFSPILGAFIQAPIFMCFFFAIRNMAEKMESFKEGGALWFTDLSTPDSLFILPVMSGAFFLLTVELGATDGMQGQPMLGKMKMFLRGLSVLLVPMTASFPKALFCYWLTANVCSIVQGVVFKQPGVKEALGIPDVAHLAKPTELPVSPVVTFSQHPRSKGESRVAGSKRQRQR